ncbi:MULTISPECIES: bifunctional 4-hydroxy-2-oxoglutarate aldolase/2-dehydro-3-deoxy-phosphogluconate aldolase [unclassified Photorhabdus]|uniref:bifunctional 4-hydroxy-2-oxoglutarate aldolase/2-dehydro-3-deoxy-phosphogluconate aldolase n=1 Tax=unclassified Photorhabdus TaxID=2620880 RepID=UPI000DCEB459|nr:MULTISPECIES: bifunctional 4-hydroxy-2-oxoglutarate aldolase/2-dehydro-3-deoxy-phosphogluconate aldolase [unclassified Photorhabdus]RAW96407.1 2-dehydro-3-deoxyphosphogluconate aldolase [Photorhabdus sp. S10-54]RAW96607.1 2-dehydro-3-deoxyphosphogluconate aldolase [Photorhabdus sp. S9-53]RAX00849.1 2-dehydro-3-deoxyphosphogluconate aldolase [Photorhabdus sp. S8-52]
MRQMIEQLHQLKIVPVITVERAEDIIPLGKVLADNGLPVAEITFRSTVAAEAIRLLREAQPNMLIGAGTVLNREQVVAAKQAGADFMVSPGFNPNTVKACQQLNIPIIPGVNNPSAIEGAMELGLKLLKFFPAEPSGGLPMIKAILAPYTELQIMPTGGIGPNNIRDYLAVPRIVACGGSWMVSQALVDNRNWQEIGRLTREAVDLVNT